MYVVVNPPREGDVSYSSFIEQKAKILASFADRAKLVTDTLNSIEGYTCNTVQGALYAFPKVSWGLYLKLGTLINEYFFVLDNASAKGN